MDVKPLHRQLQAYVYPVKKFKTILKAFIQLYFPSGELSSKTERGTFIFYTKTMWYEFNVEDCGQNTVNETAFSKPRHQALINEGEMITLTLDDQY